MLNIDTSLVSKVNFGNKTVNVGQNAEKVTYPQVNELQKIQPDYQVKTPMAYTVLPDIKLPNDLTAKCYKLANGQKVVVVPKKGETTIRTYVNTGSMNEPDNQRGISHYIEHNLFNGSNGLKAGEFFQRVHEMGGETNASTGFDQTNYYISSNLLRESDFEDMVKYHSSMLETPKFTQETLDKEKGIVCSEINMINQNPENIVVNNAIRNLYQINTSSVDMVGGSVENIQNLTREDVIKYYNDNYYPANMTTVITGDVTPENAIGLVSKYFSSYVTPSATRKYENLKPIEVTKREDIISDKASSTTMVIAIDGPQNANLKDRLALDCAMELLVGGVASRVNSKLREKDVYVDQGEERFGNLPTSNTIRLFDATSNDEGVETALKTILTELKNFDSVPISEKELNVIKKSAIKYNLIGYENNFAINNAIGTAFLNGETDSIENFEKIMNSITPDDVKNAVKKYLSKDNFAISVIHPSGSTPENIKAAYDKANNAAVSFTGSLENKNTKLTQLREVEPLDLTSVGNYILPNNVNLITNNTKEKIGYIRLTFDRKEIDLEHPVEAAVLSRLLNNGTMKKTDVELNKALKDSNIGMQISAGSEKLRASANFYAEDMNKMFEELKEIIYSPRFTQEEFDKEVKFIKRDLELAKKSAYDKLHEELDPTESLSKEEILKKLDTLTLDDVKNLYEKILTNSQVSATVSGPIETDKNFKNSLLFNLATLPGVKKFEYDLREVYKPVETTKVLTDTDFKPQAEVLEHYRFKISHNVHDNVALTLMNKILGGGASSRLFLDLRERQQLAYSVRSTLMMPNMSDKGSLTLSIGTTTENPSTGKVNDNLKKSIDGFNYNIERLKTEKVSEEELYNAKLALKNSLLNAVQTTSDKTAELSRSLSRPDGITSINKLMDEIDKITPDDIYNAANYVFSHKPTYSILATENTIKENTEYLKTLEG